MPARIRPVATYPGALQSITSNSSKPAPPTSATHSLATSNPGAYRVASAQRQLRAAWHASVVGEAAGCAAPAANQQSRQDPGSAAEQGNQTIGAGQLFNAQQLIQIAAVRHPERLPPLCWRQGSLAQIQQRQQATPAPGQCQHHLADLKTRPPRPHSSQQCLLPAGGQTLGRSRPPLTARVGAQTSIHAGPGAARRQRHARVLNAPERARHASAMGSRLIRVAFKGNRQGPSCSMAGTWQAP